MTLPEKLEALETLLENTSLPADFAALCRQRMVAGHEEHGGDIEAVDVVREATEELSDFLNFFVLGIARGVLDRTYTLDAEEEVRLALHYLHSAARDAVIGKRRKVTAEGPSPCAPDAPTEAARVPGGGLVRNVGSEGSQTYTNAGNGWAPWPPRDDRCPPSTVEVPYAPETLPVDLGHYNCAADFVPSAAQLAAQEQGPWEVWGTRKLHGFDSPDFYATAEMGNEFVSLRDRSFAGVALRFVTRAEAEAEASKRSAPGWTWRVVEVEE